MASSIEVISQSSLDILNEIELQGTQTGDIRRVQRGIMSLSSNDAAFSEELDIPVYLDNMESLRFIGLKKDAATQVLHNFREHLQYLGDDRPTTWDAALELLSFATGHLEGRGNAMDATDDWLGSLKSMGIERSTREGICDPEFEHIKLTRSAKEWAKETLTDGWEFLCGIDAAIKRNRAYLQRRHEQQCSQN